jgi:hypothetical protein
MAGIALTFATFLLGISGILFNWVILKTVFQFSTLIGNSEGLLAAWTILRDIGNMLLLFGFIFIGISTILDLHSYPAKKTLPFLIIFAVLMNFSLFAAEAVIDTANGLSSVVYNQANTDPCFSDDVNAGSEIGGISEDGKSEQGCAINYGISAHIMESTGISSLFRNDESIFDISTTSLLATTILAFIAAGVLFGASIMLIIRAVTLTFLMVTAPIGFAGMAIPPLRKIGEQWWHNLINQSFFAPVMLLLMLISLKITDGLAGMGTRGSLMQALTTGKTGMMGVILIYALVIGFLLASLAAARKFGAAGASFAIATAGKTSIGAMGFMGRRTVGRAASKASERIRATDWGHTEMGYRMASIADYGGKASFDFRATALGGTLGKQVGDLGKAHKGGYADLVHHGEEARVKYAKSLKQTDDDKAIQTHYEQKKETIGTKKETAQKTWADEKRTMEKAANKLKDEYAEIEKTRAAQREAQMAQLNAAANAAAEADDDKPEIQAARRAAVEREQEALNALLEVHRATATKERDDIRNRQEAIADRQKDHDQAMKDFDKDIKDAEANIEKAKKAPMTRYANDLHESSGTSITAKGRARHHAYEAIKKEMKKSKSEKLFDELKGEIAKSGKDTHEIKEHAERATKAADKEDGHGDDHGDDHGHDKADH